MTRHPQTGAAQQPRLLYRNHPEISDLQNLRRCRAPRGSYTGTYWKQRAAAKGKNSKRRASYHSRRVRQTWSVEKNLGSPGASFAPGSFAFDFIAVNPPLIGTPFSDANGELVRAVWAVPTGSREQVRLHWHTAWMDESSKIVS
jgi:hypothetical protein